MSYKSLLCAAAMLAVSGVAQAFPDYSWYPQAGAELSDSYYLGNIQLQMPSAGSISISNSAAPYLMSENGDVLECTNIMDLANMDSNAKGTIAFFFNSDEVKENGVWTFTLPEGSLIVDGEANEKLQVSWTLNDSNIITGEFPQISLVSIEPADGSKLAAWGVEGDGVLQYVKVQTSDDAAVNFIEATLYDITSGEDDFIWHGEENRIDVNRNDDGKAVDEWANGIRFAVGGYAQLLLGHTYRLDLTFCGIGYDPINHQYPTPAQKAASVELKTSVFYEGLTPEPEYSPIEYVSVSPSPEEYSITNPDLAFFHIEYSGMVKPIEFNYMAAPGLLPSAGTFEPYEGTEVDADGYAAHWTFTFSKSLIETVTGTLNTNVITKDKDGLYVKGNADILFDNINYHMDWECNCGAPDLISVSPAENAELESLSSITVSNEKDGTTYVMAYSYVPKDGAKAEIRTLDMATVRTLGEPVISEDELSATWTFEPITEAGTYILMIPANYFAIGEEFDGASSNETSFRYYVVGQQVVGEVDYSFVPASITPEDGEDLESIETVTVVYGQEGIMSSWDEAFYAKLYKKSLVEDENGWYIETFEEVASASIVDDDYWNPTYGTYTFEPAITEVGEYKLVIPEGAFGDSEYFDSDMTSGIASKEIELYYTVSEPAPLEPAQYSVKAVSVTPKDGAVVSEISAVTVQFSEVVFPTQTVDGAEVIMPEAQLVRIDGTKEELVESVPSDAGDNLFAPTTYTFNFTEVTEKGVYNVVIPRGIFGDNAFLDSKGATGIANEEITVMLIVSGTVGIESILDGEKTVNVYDVNGVQLLKDADVDAVKDLKSGLYIINGKKVMIRK